MRVGVNGRGLGSGRGVAHYTVALLGALAQGHPGDEWVLFVPGRDPVPALAGLAGRANVALRRHPLPSRALFGSAALAGRPRLDRLLGGGLDVVWAPAPRPLALSRAVPFVLTVHDLSFEDRPQDFTTYERLWHRLMRPSRLARRAARVMVNARVTADEVAARWGVARTRIAVVAPGVEPAPAAAPVTAPRPYVLAVGALEPRKDPETLLAAYGRARAAGFEADLVFAGAGRLAPRLHGPGVRVLGHVGDDELDGLYRGALALVMASRLEGFGWPPLEASVRGTPAIVADLPVYRETLGDGALRFPAGDAAALARALTRIAGDADLRARLVSDARSAIARLTWERAAADAHATLAEAAGR